MHPLEQAGAVSWELSIQTGPGHLKIDPLGNAIPFSGVAPMGCLYWEQHQPRMGDKGRRRVQSRIIIARVSLGPGPPSWPGWAWLGVG